MRGLLFAIALASSTAGCLRSTEFHCTSSADCSATGAVCESNGYCSFIDTGCSGGRRYGDLSGPVAGQCVGSVMGPDGGVDSMPDGGGNGCPSAYAALGGSAHRYRVLSTAGTWASQKALCTADGAGIYLAVPDDQTELTSMLAATAADAWFGIDDMTTEGTFKTAKGATFSSTSALWDTAGGIEPDAKPEAGGGANPNVDCVMGKTATNRLSDDLCSVTYKAICECEP